MKKRCASVLLAVTMFAQTVQAQETVDAATPTDTTAIGRLAWSIQAYAPCDWTSSLEAIEQEIAVSGASVRETSTALSQVLRAETVCDPVKDAAARLLARLPDETPILPEPVIDEVLPPVVAEPVEPAAPIIATTQAPAPVIIDPVVNEPPPAPESTLELTSDVADYLLQPEATIFEISAPQPLPAEISPAEISIENESELVDLDPQSDVSTALAEETIFTVPNRDELDVAFKLVPPPGNPEFRRN